MISFMIGVDEALNRTLSAPSAVEADPAAVQARTSAVDVVLAAMNQVFSLWFSAVLDERNGADSHPVAAGFGNGLSLLGGLMRQRIQTVVDAFHAVDALFESDPAGTGQTAPSEERNNAPSAAPAEEGNDEPSAEVAHPDQPFFEEPPLQSQVLENAPLQDQDTEDASRESECLTHRWFVALCVGGLFQAAFSHPTPKKNWLPARPISPTGTSYSLAASQKLR
jgi:hypothetical protein